MWAAKICFNWSDMQKYNEFGYKDLKYLLTKQGAAIYVKSHGTHTIRFICKWSTNYELVQGNKLQEKYLDGWLKLY